jgi:hypothetical protein
MQRSSLEGDCVNQARMLATLDTALPGGGERGVCIAVLDGPVDQAHACFIGADLTVLPTLAAEGAGNGRALAHGTHVASIIFGQPGGPVRGIAPNCRGLIVPIFSDAGQGLACSQLDLARAILSAVDNGAHIINISGGQFVTECAVEADLASALAACEERRVLVIAAAGNDGCDCSHVPACVSTVLAVGAIGLDGQPLTAGNWGLAYAMHGVIAPGEKIIGAKPGGGVATRTGTSFAKAIASGTAARMLGASRTNGGANDPLTVRARLAGTVIGGDRRDAQPRAPATWRPPIHPNQTGNRGRAIMNLSGNEHPSGGFSADNTQGVPLPPEGERGRAIGLSEVLPSTSESNVTASCADGQCGCGGAPKDCGCGCGGAKKAAAAPPQLVYALGQIGYDFGSVTRRDSIAQFNKGVWPESDEALIEYLRNEGAEDVERLIWVLKLDGTPIYALKPVGAFAPHVYTRILNAFAGQIGIEPVEEPTPKKDGKKKKTEKVLLTAVPGYIAGSVQLISGETVPILVPSSRGIMPWNIKAAIDDFFDEAKRRAESDEAIGARLTDILNDEERLRTFLEDFRNLATRKYRNLGITGRDRALNYATTSTFRVFEALNHIALTNFLLDDIEISRSAACRSGSECYDVRLRLFISSDIKASLRILQFTVDVSDTIPVNIGEVSAWNERPT